MSLHELRDPTAGGIVVMSGNEAIARGALEAGLSYVAAYPGSPSSEVLASLAALAGEHGFYAEWSTNEKVAAEGAAAGSFAGLRAMTIMKADGLNVALDFFSSLAYSGTRGGLAVVVSDDPGAHSSSKEEDSRALIKVSHLPLVEPSTPQEAKDLVRWAFDLSEDIGLPVVVRNVTRIAHAQGSVTLGPLPPPRRGARFETGLRLVTTAGLHPVLDARIERVRERFEAAPFNDYHGPRDAERLIIVAGPAFTYVLEAVRRLGAEGDVGVLKLATVWPLPEQLLLAHLRHARRVIFLEEIEAFIETEVKALYAQHVAELGAIEFLGKASKHVAGPSGPGVGELTPEIVTSGVEALLGRPAGVVDGRADGVSVPDLPERALAFCAGCPHRASYWAIKAAVELDGREGIVLGDIGCYTLGFMETGFETLRTVHCMGAAAGLGSGFGKLDRLGLEQPVVAVVGDSTFYHSVIPALVNARYNDAKLLLIVMDNGTTAMTGHQPHAGTGRCADGGLATPVPIEVVARSLGLEVETQDPLDTDGTVESVYRLLQAEQARVLVLRSPCALLAGVKRTRRAVVDAARCIGDACGCARVCSRTFACPALVWDHVRRQTRVDEVLCNGCGVCAGLCPRAAIRLEDVT